MSLSHSRLASRVRVTGIRSNGAFAQRLMEMGVIEGAELHVLRRAPLGDPLHIRVGDCELSLRSADAEMIDVGPA